MGHMAIGEVARLAGIRTSAIRYYERVGLLPAPQRINGRRRYEANVLKKIALIHFAQRAGLTVGEIRKLYYEFPADIPPSVRWQNISSRKLTEVEVLLSKITTMKTLLESTLRCNCPTLDDCGVETTTQIDEAQNCSAEKL